MIKRLLCFIFLLHTVNAYSDSFLLYQDCTEQLSQAKEWYAARDYSQVITLFHTASPNSEANDKCQSDLYLLYARSFDKLGQLDSATHCYQQSLSIARENGLLENRAEAQYRYGQTLRAFGVYDESLEHLQISLSLYDSLDNDSRMGRSVNALANLFHDQEDWQRSLTYRKRYVSMISELGDERRLAIGNLNYASAMIAIDSAQCIEILHEALRYAKGKFEDLESIIHQNLGVAFTEVIKQYDSALYHYDIARRMNEAMGIEDIDLLINLGAVNDYKGDYRRAKQLYLESLSKLDTAADLGYLDIVYENLAGVNKKLGNLELAYDYQHKLLSVRARLMDEEKTKAIAEAETRYQTSEKEKQILSLERETDKAQLARQKAQTWLWVIALLLLLVAVSGYFLIKNYRSGKVIAEQKNKLDKQKIVELMRQQELIGFDAMVLGQNNERKRIAEALHDHLGSLMATLKLGFESFRIKLGQQPDPVDLAYGKLISQIDDACGEVRKVSHETRSGVLISDGLLPAIEEMVKNINDSASLEISVSGFGLDQGMDGSIELSIYRMIQELITNIIKHAEANEASIQLTMHEGSLNLLVEDNGQGFDSDSGAYDGVGLRSIRSRVNYLRGEMLVDSQNGSGTTISIDIPVA